MPHLFNLLGPSNNGGHERYYEILFLPNIMAEVCTKNEFLFSATNPDSCLVKENGLKREFVEWKVSDQRHSSSQNLESQWD